MEIINENVVNLIIALRRLEGEFTKEFEALKKGNQYADYGEISRNFWDGYSDLMNALKGLLVETAEQNANNLNLV